MKYSSHLQHHKKMDNKAPAWLYFALHNYSAGMKTTNPVEIMINVLHALERHKEERAKHGLGIELKPNNYDAAGAYGKCPCPDCCKVSLDSTYQKTTGPVVTPTPPLVTLDKTVV